MDDLHIEDGNSLSESSNASGDSADKTLVSGFNLFLTIVGFTLYLVDMGSDIGTAIFFASNGQWWQVIVTLTIVYTAVFNSQKVKWMSTGAAAWLRHVAGQLANLKLYWSFCRLEWKLHKSRKNARRVSEWDRRRSILLLCLLVPDLYGAWSWTDYLRITGASISLCTAGAALVNWEKFNRISNYIDVPLNELVVLHVWAVPVTVFRLLSLGLLLSVHPYWALADVALHLVLCGVYWCRTEGVPHELVDVIYMCLATLLLSLSPFAVDYSIKHRRESHAIHFLGNTAATVVWALGTPLVCVYPTLYTASICLNAVMFAVGLGAWQLHEKHWPGSYPKYNS